MIPIFFVCRKSFLRVPDIIAILWGAAGTKTEAVNLEAGVAAEQLAKMVKPVETGSRWNVRH